MTTERVSASQQDSVGAYITRQRLHRRLRPVMAWGLRLLIRVLGRIRVHGAENVPESGSAIVMINHISALDPAIVTGVIPKRHAITMVKAETMTSYPFIIRTLLKLWGHLPVWRDKLDTTALRKALALLENGNLLLLAPEGTRRPDGLDEARAGIAYLATKADCVIVPVAIVGSTDWRTCWKKLRPVPVQIYFGQPFRFKAEKRPNKAQRDLMMQEAMYRIALLIPEEYAALRGTYGDVAGATTKTLEFRQ